MPVHWSAGLSRSPQLDVAVGDQRTEQGALAFQPGLEGGRRVGDQYGAGGIEPFPDL